MKKVGNFSRDENQTPPPLAALPQSFISPIDKAPFDTYVHEVLGAFTIQFSMNF